MELRNNFTCRFVQNQITSLVFITYTYITKIVIVVKSSRYRSRLRDNRNAKWLCCMAARILVHFLAEFRRQQRGITNK